jgi:hypothetical protein
MNGTKNNAKELDEKIQMNQGVCDTTGATQRGCLAEDVATKREWLANAFSA